MFWNKWTMLSKFYRAQHDYTLLSKHLVNIGSSTTGCLPRHKKMFRHTLQLLLKIILEHVY